MKSESFVYLVDDDSGVLKALTRLLRMEGYTVRAFATADGFLQAYDPLVPGCAVLDMVMPGLDGLALQRRLQSLGGDRRVIFISGHADIDNSVQAMKAGAVDFLSKPFNDDSFLAAVHRAIAQDQQARQLQAEFQSIRLRLDRLTPREHEVMKQVVAGRLNKQIAADLGIAEKTIKVYRARAMEKMGAGSLAELVRISIAADRGQAVETFALGPTPDYQKSRPWHSGAGDRRIQDRRARR